MERTYGVGIVGAGGILPTHLTAYRNLAGRMRVVGVADLDESRLGRAGQRSFIPFATTDYRRLLERKDIDVIDVCTPPAAHAKIVKDALQAGKLVICEKPLAPTLAQVDELIEFARAHPGRLSVVLQRRYRPITENLLLAKDDGSLGTLVGGSFTCIAKGSFHREGGTWGSWATTGGGTVMTQLIHELDLMRLVFGAPVSVSAQMDTLHLGIESEDTCVASLRFASGALVTCVAATGVARSEVSFEVFGTGRVIRYRSAGDEGPPKSRIAKLTNLAGKAFTVGRSRLRVTLGGPPPPGPAGSHDRYFAAIMQALDMGRPLPIGPEEARGAVELVTAIYASALSGETVDLPLDASAPYYRGVTAADYERRDRQAASLAPAIARHAR